MTAWVKEAEDEHILLSNALMGLLRNPFLPPALFTETLKNQPLPVPLDVATFPPENGPIDKFSEIWGVLDNEMRPGVLVTVTISIDPYKPLIFKQVKSREMRVMQDTGIKHPGKMDTKIMQTRSISKTYLTMAGSIKSEKYDPSSLTVVLVEKQLPIELDAEGRFSVSSITEGEYHLDILFNKKVLKHQKILVPSPGGFDIVV